MKKYLCNYDTEYNRNLSFEFFSKFRANSKNNYKDARKESKMLFGRGHQHNITIVETILI